MFGVAYTELSKTAVCCLLKTEWCMEVLIVQAQYSSFGQRKVLDGQ